jgi:glutamate--cysteine ligase
MTITIGGSAVIHSVADAEGYIARVCFKTGPPRLTGVELEWTVHHADDPARPLNISALRAALGPHAPATLVPSSPMVPLPGGSPVTVEPGGQVELSTPPATSLAHLHSTVEADIEVLTRLLAREGLALGHSGVDPHRPPTLLVQTPRYAALARAFEAYRPHGQIMMGSTAGLQICVDAGAPEHTAQRWRALHTLGPALLAAFANSRRHAGRDTGWASTRMSAWLGLDPARTAPVWPGGPESGAGSGAGTDPCLGWARYALAASLLCVRRPDGDWQAPRDVTFADWINGALPVRPTVDDLNYHLTTLFPPVRPRGYLEVRYLDAQPPGEWIAPVAVLTTLLADTETIAEAERLAAPATGRWLAAARDGTADPGIAAAAHDLLQLASAKLNTVQPFTDVIRRRIDETRVGEA